MRPLIRGAPGYPVRSTPSDNDPLLTGAKACISGVLPMIAVRLSGVSSPTH